MASNKAITVGKFNQNHPELMTGEMFLTNSASNDFRHIGHKTKRVGLIAYDIYGNVVSGLKPVFVQKQEYEEKLILIAHRRLGSITTQKTELSRFMLTVRSRYIGR